MTKARFKYHQGRLYLNKYNLSMVARQYGSPIYLYDGDRVRENYKAISSAFMKKFKDFSLCYAIKANSNLEIMKIVQSMGGYANVDSAVEIFLAKKAGFDLSKCSFTAVNPTDEDLEWAVKHKLIINLDDLSQLPRVLKFGRPHMLTFRINPGVKAGRYDQLKTGAKDSKFGISPDEAMNAYRKASRAGVVHFGIYTMLGSGVLDPSYYTKSTKKILKIAAKLADNLGITFKHVNIGGGFGIPYEYGEVPLDLNATAKEIHDQFAAFEKDIGTPELIIEPGRYIVGDAGMFLTTVNTIKERENQRYVGVDGGMSHLLRPMLYGAYHEIMPLKARSGRPIPQTIVGPICENTDCFAKDRKLPKIVEGDILAILNAGAYGYSMSSQYNGRLRPVEVMLEDGKHHVIRRKEEMKDILM